MLEEIVCTGNAVRVQHTSKEQFEQHQNIQRSINIFLDISLIYVSIEAPERRGQGITQRLVSVCRTIEAPLFRVVINQMLTASQGEADRVEPKTLLANLRRQ
ncbi:unnamed protein product [Kuraishia capsulata CBS 1993]|uniref:Uncharacterized protein n=1 Tax=Kuraishia capsulata CBS 1993 TaxID=1382522 RepID=W6MI94_9ASCO|nr:uncharacterized protein KUCA_T00002125001 [Kuraishia capsulata CBS 1993]CDK26154.1 unnamed protein product [Kuraishia capsulata CBS 1993]